MNAKKIPTHEAYKHVGVVETSLDAMLLLSSLIWLACLNAASAQNTHALRMIMTDSRFVGLVS